MNQQQEARRAAAQAFRESLEKLQQTLGSADLPAGSPSPAESAPPSGAVAKGRGQVAKIDLAVWEDAIADIDHFIEAQHHPEATD